MDPFGAAAESVLAGLAVSAWTDVRTGYIFDRVVIACGVIVAIAKVLERDTASALWGAAACGSALGLLWVVTRGRGLGLGDVKLGALVGSALGVGLGFASLGTAFILGGAYIVGLALFRRLPADRTVVFGPFIALGGAIAMVSAAATR